MKRFLCTLLPAYRQLHSAWRRMVLATALTLLALGAAYLLLPADRNLGVDAHALPFYSQPFGNNPLAPGEWKTPDGKLVDWRAIPSARDCASCHRKEFMEWNTSLHAVSDQDVIYDASVTRNTTRSHAAGTVGDQKGRWCESCHNPLGTLTGAVNPIQAVPETETLEEGVSCIACHTASHPEPLAGNGGLTSNINRYFRHFSEVLIAAAPARHAQDMQAKRTAPHMGQSGLCGACHTEIRPTDIHGQHRLDFQTTYDEWRTSEFARQGIACQTCHMASDPAATIAALQRHETPPRGVSHRLVGGNYLLTNPQLPDRLVSTLRGGAPAGQNRLFSAQDYRQELGTTNQQVLGLLQSAAQLDVRLHPTSPHRLQLEVVVRNTGAGHALPTGPLDQRHMWLEVEVTDARGTSLLHSGAFNAKTGQVDADAVMWVKRMVNDAGQLDLQHTLFDVAELHYPRKPIPAGGQQTVHYTVPLKTGARGPFQARVTLHYRLAFQEILNTLYEEDMGDLRHIIIPPVTMARATAALDKAKISQVQP